MKKTIFEGMATALITPITADGVDYEAFGKLIDWQIEEGIDGLVICGTTGEGSTLTDDEHKEAIKFAVERANKRVPIIAGTGSNDTAYALELTEYACSVGVDAVLVVDVGLTVIVEADFAGEGSENSHLSISMACGVFPHGKGHLRTFNAAVRRH